jgi:protein-S-isoprenylcysteine O-methyltransferase Ste14
VAISTLALTAVPQASIPGGITTFSSGLIVACGGLGLRVWAFDRVGRNVAPRSLADVDLRITRTGPYRFLRYPAYLGAFLTLTGVGIMTANWICALALALVPLVGLINRIQVEEQALYAGLGDAYSRYASGRKCLIPFLW